MVLGAEGFKRLLEEGGAHDIELNVEANNEGALRLYRRFGFRQVAVRPGYYPAHGGREDALVLTLAL